MLRGFATVSFWADDLEAATKWYTELLGVEPYFQRPGRRGPAAYVEFRIGDYQARAGHDRQRATRRPGRRPAGWRRHVLARRRCVRDPGAAAVWAPRSTSRTHRPGSTGFVTASVVDPFGNILGIMYNPHYLEVLGARGPGVTRAEDVPPVTSGRR